MHIRRVHGVGKLPGQDAMGIIIQDPGQVVPIGSLPSGITQ